MRALVPLLAAGLLLTLGFAGPAAARPDTPNPMPLVQPREPGPVPMPDVAPERPGPVPMPEARTGSDDLAPLLPRDHNLLPGGPDEIPRGPSDLARRTPDGLRPR